TYRRTSVPSEASLVDDGGERQSVDPVHIRRRMLRQSIPHERRICPGDQSLGLGRDRVEGQRRLPRARDPGEHRESMLRYTDRDPAKVVRARTFHGDPACTVVRCCAVCRHVLTLRAVVAGSLPQLSEYWSERRRDTVTTPGERMLELLSLLQSGRR